MTAVVVPSLRATEETARGRRPSIRFLGGVGTAPSPPRTYFVVHGEPEASGGLADAIRGRLGWRAIVPRQDELVLLGRRPARSEAA